MKHTLLPAACLLALLPSPLLAQDPENPPPARFIFGPLGLTPKVALKDVGIDSNPLNQSADAEQDFTATLVPGLDSWLRVGRGRLSSESAVEYLYFNESRTQRSFNFRQNGRAELVLNRLIPFVAGGYQRTRQRPNFEIDQRVQQNTAMAAAGTGLKLATRMRLELEGRRTSLRFAEGKYGDIAIGEALDRDSDNYGVATRFVLTPLTTFVVRTERAQDRFISTPRRDSDSISVLPGFELKPSALISGKIFVGYRRFDARDVSVPDFGGLVGQVDAAYTLREATRFNFRGDRNIEYSIEDDQPYFVANGGSVEVTQIIGLNWFVIGRAGRSRLVYRNYLNRATSPLDRPGLEVGRNDRIDIFGFGFGRRLGEDLRVGVDLNHVNRTSIVRSREYEGYRFGVSISYGS